MTDRKRNGSAPSGLRERGSSAPVRKQSASDAASWGGVDSRRAPVLDFYEQAPVGCCALDGQGRILDVNPLTASWLNVPRESLPGRFFSRYVVREDRDKFRRFRRDLCASNPPSSRVCELRLVQSDDTFLWVHLAGSAGRDAATNPGPPSGNATILRLVLLDIHARKRAEIALREDQERYRQLAAENRTFIWESDLRGMYTYVDPMVASILGYRPEELVGQKYFYDLAPEEDRETLREFGLKMIGQGQAISRYENRMVARDGRVVWVSSATLPVRDAQGRVVGARGSDTDIGVRKRMETDLAEERRRLDFIMTATRTHINMIDADYNLRHVDANWRKVFGDPEGRKCYQYFLQQDAPCPACGAGTALKTGKVCVNESFLPREDRTYEVHSIPLRNENGEWLIAQFNVDITERLRLTFQLQQAQKMESVGRLAGGVAHDFNNMLGIILGYAEMALDRLDADNPLRAELEEICKATQSSARLTRQLLAFARKQVVAPKVLQLNESVAGMFRMIQRLIGEGIRVTWKPGRDLWPVRVDPGQVDQILANLCVNARDAIPDGMGNITIETENVILGDSYCARYRDCAPGEYVLLAVSDDGCGIPPEMIPRLFEPFFTTKDDALGTGLGLSTVYGAVRQNLGCIHVYSEPGQGTTFKVYLPRHTGAGEPEAAPTPAPAPSRGSETVLLVEDQPAILKMTSIMLESQGYTVLAALTPGRALRLCREYPERIDVLITDVVMPEMNGRDLADAVHSIHPDIRCLFMSGYTVNVVAQRGNLDADVHFIQKPFTRNELMEKLRAVLSPETN